MTGPVRTCIGCRRVGPATSMVRYALDGDRLRAGRHRPGRGAWLCADDLARCFDLATDRRQWQRALRSPVAPDSIVEVRPSVG